MVNWLYDTLGTVARAVPAVVGGYFGGASGAMAGYQLGATIVPTQQKGTITQKNVSIGAYNPNAGLERNPSKRETDYYTQINRPKTGWEKFGDVSDTVNKSAMGLSGSGLFGKSKGALSSDKQPTSISSSPEKPDPLVASSGIPSPNYGGQENSKWGVSDIQYPKMPSIGFPLMGSSDQQSSELKIPQVDNTIMQPSGSEITSGTQDDIYGKKWTSPLTKSEITNDLLQQTEDLKKKLQDFQKYNQ